MTTVGRIISALSATPRTAADLAHELGVRVSSVSQILSILRAAGLVEVWTYRPRQPGERGRPQAVFRLTRAQH